VVRGAACEEPVAFMTALVDCVREQSDLQLEFGTVCATETKFNSMCFEIFFQSAARIFLAGRLVEYCSSRMLVIRSMRQVMTVGLWPISALEEQA
jgi:hypothetical protein